MAPRHTANCIDEEGKVECICGLEDLEQYVIEGQIAAYEASEEAREEARYEADADAEAASRADYDDGGEF